VVDSIITGGEGRRDIVIEIRAAKEKELMIPPRQVLWLASHARAWLPIGGLPRVHVTIATIRY
jgi:hypothetical protein